MVIGIWAWLTFYDLPLQKLVTEGSGKGVAFHYLGEQGEADSPSGVSVQHSGAVSICHGDRGGLHNRRSLYDF